METTIYILKILTAIAVGAAIGILAGHLTWTITHYRERKELKQSIEEYKKD